MKTSPVERARPVYPQRQIWIFLARVCVFSLVADTLRINGMAAAAQRQPVAQRFPARQP
ncbi:hypothetical protein [Duganella callida]|uniref:hypothetical protein n=1 Tax=Duganella callida TaxID=2561932 RepID=UPI00142F5636|nr:hypothetical protein [Duganella callida]